MVVRDAGGFELVDVELELRAVVDQDRDVAEARRPPAKQCEIGPAVDHSADDPGDRIGLILARLVEVGVLLLGAGHDDDGGSRFLAVRLEDLVLRLRRRPGLVSEQDPGVGAVVPGDQLRAGAEVDAKARLRRPLGVRVGGPLEEVADLRVSVDVGAPEAVDRLLRVAHHQQSARRRGGVRPVVGLVLGGEQQHDLGLQRVGVLELVDQDVRVALAEEPPRPGTGHEQVARLDQQIFEGQASFAATAIGVVTDERAEHSEHIVEDVRAK